MLIGYARVSTDEQDPAMQERELRDYGCERVYTDFASGKNLNRPKWEMCRRDIRQGDTLVVWRLDRLARSVLDLHTLLDQFQREGIELVILREAIDTRTPMGKLFFTISSAFAEFERNVISERTKSGMKERMAEGMIPGPKPWFTPDRWGIAIDFLRSQPQHGRNITPHRLAKELTAAGHKVTPQTVGKWRKNLQLAAEQADENGEPIPADKVYPDDWRRKLEQIKQNKKADRKGRKR